MSDSNQNTGGFVAPRNSAPSAPAAPSTVFVPALPPAAVGANAPIDTMPAPAVPGSAGGPAYMFTPPAEAPRESPDPTLGVPGGIPAVPAAPPIGPVGSLPGAGAVDAGASAAFAAPAPQPASPAAPGGLVGFSVQPPQAAPSPSSGLTPEQKAARAKAIAEAAQAVQAKTKRRIRIEDVPSGQPSAPAPASQPAAAQASAPPVEAQASTPAPASEPPSAAPAKTGDDLLDHPNVKAAKARIAAEKSANGSAKRDLRAMTKGERRKEKARRKKEAKAQAREEKKLARAEKLAAKKQAIADRKAARAEKREAKLAKKLAAKAKKAEKKTARKAAKADRSASAKRASRAGADGHKIGDAIIFTVRVAKADAKRIIAEAKAKDLKLSEYIRKRLGA